jgi:hypothetical protein
LGFLRISPAVYRGPDVAAGMTVPVTSDCAEELDAEELEQPAMKMVIVRSTIRPDITRYFRSIVIILSGKYKNRFS